MPLIYHNQELHIALVPGQHDRVTIELPGSTDLTVTSDGRVLRDGEDKTLALAKREVAEELMGLLRNSGCRDDDWNGGDVVEAIDTWLQKQGVDTHVYECEAGGCGCGEVFATAAERDAHYTEPAEEE